MYAKLYQTIVSLVHFISETMRSMSNYIRHLSPLYVLSQNPWELCQIISVRQLSPLYVLSQKPWELCQIISDNCLPCMFYLRTHESNAKLYQTIVSLVPFISETMRVMSNYIRKTIVSLVCFISETMRAKCQIISDNCLPCTFISEPKRLMSNYISQTIVLYVLSQKPRELCQIISDNCLPCIFYLRTHESYVKLYQTIVSLVLFISETMRVMSNYIRQTIVSLRPFILETMRAMSNYIIWQLSPLYVLSRKPWELCQINL